MEKTILFTDEQKSLIWRTKLSPNGATQDDARIFMDICEKYGLDPILGEIVFQRFETKRGPVTNFVVSRDGYLKAAMRDKDFVKCVSAVIREGDDFEMDIDGNVIHKFGKKRGPIIGAWAFAEHAKRGKLPVNVDFQEYFVANAASQNGKSYVWDSMPSAMIQKVAEVAALRRQFPLGGIVAAEEMGLDQLEIEQFEKQVIEQPTTKNTEELPKKENKEQVGKSSNTVKKEKKSSVSEKVEVQSDKEDSSEEKEIKQKGKLAQKESVEPLNQESLELPLDEKVVINDEKETFQEDVDSKLQAWTVLMVKAGKSPQTGTPFAKVALENDQGEKTIALARGEVLDLLDEVEESQPYLFELENVNGYVHIIKIAGLAVA
ncbi:recombinase RecT [Bacillus sp. Gen3]|nr:recombinase RecT [Bacillus sp. Gen3]